MDLVTYEHRAGVGWITFTNPDAGNALTPEMADQFSAALRNASHDDVGVVVVQAQGRYFSVGADIRGFTGADVFDDYVIDLATHGHRIIAELTRSDAVVVSVVQGTAAGIGFPIALAADLVIAADTAQFTLGYTRIGLTGDGGTGLLARSIGLHRALRLALLNDVLTAEEAYAEGLVARVFPAAELEVRVEEFVARLAGGSRSAQAGIKRIIRTAATNDIESQLALEARTITEAARHPDAREGITAFLEKRRPEFRRTDGGSAT